MGGGVIKDSDVDNMDVDHDDGHEVHMLAPDGELPEATLEDAERLHKSFLKLRPSMLVKDNEYFSTDSDSEAGEVHAEEVSLLLSESARPDVCNASECLHSHCADGAGSSH